MFHATPLRSGRNSKPRNFNRRMFECLSKFTSIKIEEVRMSRAYLPSLHLALLASLIPAAPSKLARSHKNTALMTFNIHTG